METKIIFGLAYFVLPILDGMVHGTTLVARDKVVWMKPALRAGRECTLIRMIDGSNITALGDLVNN
jgi:hypothetical protein